MTYLTQRITKMVKRRISYYLWFKLIKQLRKKGANRRESGAFLLGTVGQYKISEFICYDELDPNCLSNGMIEFDGSGYVPLWKYCEDNKLTVLADVHTHPNKWTGQSLLDQKYPMIKQRGHIALIVPEFAIHIFQFLNGVGIYEYLGNSEWKTSTQGIKLTWL